MLSYRKVGLAGSGWGGVVTYKGLKKNIFRYRGYKNDQDLLNLVSDQNKVKKSFDKAISNFDFGQSTEQMGNDLNENLIFKKKDLEVEESFMILINTNYDRYL